jgi:hypothetical protein
MHVSNYYTAHAINKAKNDPISTKPAFFQTSQCVFFASFLLCLYVSCTSSVLPTCSCVSCIQTCLFFVISLVTVSFGLLLETLFMQPPCIFSMISAIEQYYDLWSRQCDFDLLIHRPGEGNKLRRLGLWQLIKFLVLQSSWQFLTVRGSPLGGTIFWVCRCRFLQLVAWRRDLSPSRS